MRAVITFAELLAYAKQQSRIYSRDYFDPRCPRPNEIAAWQEDRRIRNRDRRRVFKTFKEHIAANPPLIPGHYGRLEITSKDVEFTACQYPAREIWPVIFNYLNQTTQTI